MDDPGVYKYRNEMKIKTLLYLIIGLSLLLPLVMGLSLYVYPSTEFIQLKISVVFSLMVSKNFITPRLISSFLAEKRFVSSFELLGNVLILLLVGLVSYVSIVYEVFIVLILILVLGCVYAASTLKAISNEFGIEKYNSFRANFYLVSSFVGLVIEELKIVNFKLT